MFARGGEEQEESTEVPDRVCVFIDGSNFYHACKANLGRADINIGAFATSLVTPNRSLVRTYYYNCLLPPDVPESAREAQQKFISALDHTPYLEVRLGKLVRRESTCSACGNRQIRWVEKGVDMRVGIDMLSGASKNLYDTAILVCGDGDLAEAVRAVKDLGRHVEVAAFPAGRAHELLQASDVCHDLDAAAMSAYYLRP